MAFFIRVFLFCMISLTVMFAADEDAQLKQIRKDVKILSTILERHKANPFANDPEYTQLGDSMINSCLKWKLRGQEDKFEKVQELYEKDKEENKLNSLRITWLGIQLSMAITPSIWPKKLPVCSSDKYIEILEKPHNGTPLWLLDFNSLEQAEMAGNAKLFSGIKVCHLFAVPFAIYTGNSAFSTTELFTNVKHGVFPYCLNAENGKGHIVHGGIFKKPNQKTLHDIIHYHTQWLQEDHFHTYKNFQVFKNNELLIQQYHHHASVWKKIALNIENLLHGSNNSLTNLEKAKFEVCSFLMMHKGDYTVPVILGELKSPYTLLEAVIKISQNSQTEIKKELGLPNDKKLFYQEFCEQDAKDMNRTFAKVIEIREDSEVIHKVYVTYEAQDQDKTKVYKRTLYFSGMKHYEHWKTFYRDLGHLLIQKNLWKAKNEKLGTTYEMPKVLNVILDCYKWFFRELGPQKKLHQAFSKRLLANE